MRKSARGGVSHRGLIPESYWFAGMVKAALQSAGGRVMSARLLGHGGGRRGHYSAFRRTPFSYIERN